MFVQQGMWAARGPTWTPSLPKSGASETALPPARLADARPRIVRLSARQRHLGKPQPTAILRRLPERLPHVRGLALRSQIPPDRLQGTKRVELPHGGDPEAAGVEGVDRELDVLDGPTHGRLTARARDD